jgi:hypothetical protein
MEADEPTEGSTFIHRFVRTAMDLRSVGLHEASDVGVSGVVTVDDETAESVAGGGPVAATGRRTGMDARERQGSAVFMAAGGAGHRP